MANFGSLKNEVLLLVIDTPTAVQTLVASFVNRAVRKLQTKHNYKVMEAEATFTTAEATRALGIRPSNWKMARGKPYELDDRGFATGMFYLDRANAVFRYGDSTDDTGNPRTLVENDQTGNFDVYPYSDGNSSYDDGEYRVTVPYWAYLNPLLSDSDTNWFTNNAEQWIIYQAVAEAFYANQDEAMAQIWETRAMREYKDVIDLDKQRIYAETDVMIPHLGAMRPHTEE